MFTWLSFWHEFGKKFKCNKNRESLFTFWLNWLLSTFALFLQNFFFTSLLPSNFIYIYFGENFKIENCHFSVYIYFDINFKNWKSSFFLSNVVYIHFTSLLPSNFIYIYFGVNFKREFQNWKLSFFCQTLFTFILTLILKIENHHFFCQTLFTFILTWISKLKIVTFFRQTLFTFKLKRAKLTLIWREFLTQFKTWKFVTFSVKLCLL